MDNTHKRPDSVNEAIRYLESIWGDYGRHEREVKILVDYIYLLEEELKNKEEKINEYLSIAD